jgi:lipopolysaccharide heptosyltransferase I
LGTKMFRTSLPLISKEALLEVGQRQARPGLAFTPPRKLLIVRLSAIGDVVHVLPALKILRRNYPSAHIAWLVEDKAEGILRNQPGIDEVIVFPKKRWISGLKNPFSFMRTVAEVTSFIGALRRQGFEMVVDFQGNLKSGLMTFLSGSPLRVGFARGHCREGNFLFTNRWIVPSPERLHKIERNLSLLEGLGLKPMIGRQHVRQGGSALGTTMSLQVSREDEEYIASSLGSGRACSAGGPLAVIHAGTSDFGAYKRWPTANYAQLADRLVEGFDARVVFTWGPSELEMVREIISSMRRPGQLAPRTDALGQLVALIRRANLFISGDTGPMHIASIMGVPQVAIFGPKDPAIYGPYQKRALVVRKELECSPCTKRTCNDPICITSITPEEVFEATKALLRKASPSQ